MLHQKNYKGQNKCPLCKREDGWVEAKGAEFVIECSYCNNVSAIEREFTHYQLRMIHNSSTVQSYVGGYGTGKTVAAAFKKMMLMLMLPDSTALVTSATLPQIHRTFYKEIMKIIPPKVILKDNVSKEKGGSTVLINEHELIYATPNEQNIRSLNIVHAHIEEANGVKNEVYTQLLARLRQIKKDGFIRKLSSQEREVNRLREKWLHISMTSNPEDSWVTDKVLLRCENIENYTNFELPEGGKKIKSSFASVTSSYMNYYLPENYIENIVSGLNTQEEIDTYVGGDFTSKAGRVIKSVNAILYQNKIQSLDNLITIRAIDFGAGGANGDPQSYTTAYLSLVKNRKYNVANVHVYVQENIYSRETTRISEWIDIYEEHNRNTNSKFVMPLYYDNIHGNKSYKYDDRDHKIKDEYIEGGLEMEGGRNAKVDIATRNVILRDFVNSGRLHVYAGLEEGVEELKNYKQEKVDKEKVIKNQKGTKAKFKGEDHFIDNVTMILLEIPTNEKEDHSEWFYNTKAMYRVKENNSRLNEEESLKDLFFL